ncbi:MAG: phosphoadenosine phosphosulfate reductase family protein [Candidatus Poribacteria bacterium]|nr:phosphoadenosine phosphosulfate reductase family protein [Candidatus Poribacteria bacterium]
MANQVLRDLFKATDKVAVAFSGGKDSLVALHLTLQIKPDIPVLFVNTGIEFPESLEYTRKLAKDWDLNFHEANAKVNFWRLTEEQGLPVAGRGNTTFMQDLSEKADVKLSNSCCHRMKETPARQFYREHEIEGTVTGLRVSESLMRKYNFADYGALRYSSIYNALISWPLYAWLDEDIAKYIKKNNLPRNPIYELGYNRVGCWACLQDMFYKDSRLFTLQKEHPNMYKTIRKKFGKQMANLLKVWAALEDRDLTEEQLLGLYRECEFGESGALEKNAIRERKRRRNLSSSRRPKLYPR